MTHELDRVFEAIQSVQSSVTSNHTEVVQRLSTLEAKQHSPEDCPRARRIELKVDAHVTEMDIKERDSAWKGIAKEGIRVLVAAIAGISAAILNK